MVKEKKIRSPFFYVGDKYKLIPQLLELYPKKIDKYIEPFYGGGSSQLKVNAQKYLLNDKDKNIIDLHKLLIDNSKEQKSFFDMLFNIIERYELSCSFKKDVIPRSLKLEFPKTYYSRYNKEQYNKMKKDFNEEENKDLFKLYLLLIYGFNHMLRFNNENEFNLPVGNVDFNDNVYEALINYFILQKGRKIRLYNLDFEKFVDKISIGKNDFIYLDPPYLISMSEYNKCWNEDDENRLYALLDDLNNNGIKFGITNLLMHKGKKNAIFEKWSKKYKCSKITSNYISFNDNTIKENSRELYISNY